ncbi:probable amino-acid ABC transporter [Candidatus Vecturithrix granuli]|uniref:Probable amino-acid ABC transporter n=1 Tax=Vecturithrix granuli TaxID=1499967 RepID=A0A081C643_VECG1|nr:probable amino-acid ABC transporter [Candidatus Vecturithrix granuli]
MKYRPYLFVVVIALVVFAGQALSADTIRMGYFMLAPHHYKDEGAADPQGAAILYFEAVAAKMGYEVEWVGPLPLPRLTGELETGKTIDGTVGFPKYPAFEAFLYYPNAPLYVGQPIFVVHKKNPLTQIRSIDDIQGYRIGLVKSASNRYTPVIDDHRDAIQLEELGGETWIEQNLEKLISDRLQALFDRQQYSIPFVAARLHLGSEIKVLPAPAPPTLLYIAFSKASERGQLLLEQCNAVLPQIDLNYEELVQKEFDAVSQ